MDLRPRNILPEPSVSLCYERCFHDIDYICQLAVLSIGGQSVCSVTMTSTSSFSFLTTPKMGGEGHNFVETSCIIMVAPHFSPYGDFQAMSRADCPGQTRTVSSYQISMEKPFNIRIGYAQDRKVRKPSGIGEKERQLWKPKVGPSTGSSQQNVDRSSPLHSSPSSSHHAC